MLTKIKNQIVKDRKIITASLMAGLMFTTLFTFGTYAYSEKVQGGIADSVLRFHVKANSNSAEDQLLKQEVKDAVLESLSEGLPNTATKEEAIAYITENIDLITQVAENVISSKGYGYNAAAAITTDFFPTKSYGDVTLPAGEYDALRIDIGEAEGDNWWCVMFPPLCYVDLSVSKLPQSEKDNLQRVLTSREYNLVKNGKTIKNGETEVSVKFKVVEWWQNRKSGKSGSSTLVSR